MILRYEYCFFFLIIIISPFSSRRLKYITFFFFYSISVQVCLNGHGMYEFVGWAGLDRGCGMEEGGRQRTKQTWRDVPEPNLTVQRFRETRARLTQTRSGYIIINIFI